MQFTLDDLRSAFALLDYRSDRGESIPDLLAENGLRIEDVMYVAEQRGLRAALIATGEVERLRSLTGDQQFTTISLTEEQRRLKNITAACEMEAIAATLQMVRSSG